jgi:hypothetical protein
MGPVISIAERFRSYAVLCRDFAARTPHVDQKLRMLAQAAQWERDAARVQRDGEVISESIALLARMETISANAVVRTRPAPMPKPIELFALPPARRAWTA